MAFETPITVREALTRIDERKYFLPAIQREFVWKPEQIIRLFDSLLKGYPIGSFLFWTVKPENVKKYDFYHFVQHYHERDKTHNDKADLKKHGEITAVLDGQQRLTAIYIGMAGTYTYRKARHWKNNPSAYPKRRLYVCLTRASEDPDFTYVLAFREDSADTVRDANGDVWLRMGATLGWTKPSAPFALLAKEKLGNDLLATDIVAAVYESVHVAGTVSAYLEKEQGLDRVLSIFVRVNSGGTVLSYSDLLLSMATAEWSARDARETIYELVDEINHQGRGFAFSKDFILKSALMVADFETRFSTTSFTSTNMKVIEERWPEIDAAIRTTVELLVTFGLSAETLQSVNAVVPIVYYVAQRKHPTGFATKAVFEAEREQIRRWLLSAILKRTFSGQPDSILRVVRDVLQKSGGKAVFPAEAIVAALNKTARPMQVTEADLDRFLDEEYGSGYSFATLAMLYPALDFRNLFHEDHLHPQSGFTSRRLDTVKGITPKAKREYLERRDALPNLQLLDGTMNQEKAKKPLAAWLKARFPKGGAPLREYMRTHYIPDGNLDFSNFIAFTDARRELMRAQLRMTLGLAEPRLRKTGRPSTRRA